MKNLCVNKEFNNKKLSVFLQHQFNGLSINTIYKALRKKDIIVNGVRVKENINVQENDNVTVYIVDSLLYKKFDVDIIYEDDNIVALNKPSGVETINGNSTTYTDIVQEYYGFNNGFPSPCHRLDMNTSGLILFAKYEMALTILLDKFKNEEIEKHYLCTVYGIPKKNTDTLSAYLFKDSKKSIVYISDIPKKGYQKIVTSYSLVSSNLKENTSVLDVTLHTGRTHQIRAHMAHIGLPIVGDRQIWNKWG